MEELELLYNELVSAEPRLRIMMYSNFDEETKLKIDTLSKIRILERNHMIYQSTRSFYRPELRELYEHKISNLKNELCQLLTLETSRPVKQ